MQGTLSIFLPVKKLFSFLLQFKKKVVPSLHQHHRILEIETNGESYEIRFFFVCKESYFVESVYYIHTYLLLYIYTFLLILSFIHI